MLKHFSNCSWKVLGRLDANALDIHGPGHSGEIRVDQIAPGCRRGLLTGVVFQDAQVGNGICHPETIAPADA